MNNADARGRNSNDASLWVADQSRLALARPVIDRRLFMAGASAGAVSMVLPQRAEANPLLRFIGGVVFTWVIEKLLDHVWDTSSKRQKIAPYIKRESVPEYTPQGRRTYTEDKGHSVDVQFGDGDTFSGPDNHSKMYRLPQPFLKRLEIERVTWDYTFMNWGAPTNTVYWREMPDGGFLGGQWFSQIRSRYVVMRIFRDAERAPVFLPCINEYANSAHDVVRYDKKRLAGPRLADLMDRPWLYKFDKQADSPTNPQT